MSPAATASKPARTLSTSLLAVVVVMVVGSSPSRVNC
jgi:hypothetical protein